MGRLEADLDTLQQVRLVLAEAMEKGWDAAEALDRAGLLTHPVHRRRVQVETLLAVAQQLDEMGVGQLAAAVSARVPMTALDTKRLVVSLIRQETAK